MRKYYHRNYPRSTSRFVVMQEYMLQPYLALTAALGAALIYRLAQKQSLLYVGIIGVFAVIVLGRFFGNLNASRKYLEIGFDNEYFYLRSAYDLAYNKNLKFYPISYANAVKQGDVIHLNYIENAVQIRQADWQNWHEIWQALNERPADFNISVS